MQTPNTLQAAVAHDLGIEHLSHDAQTRIIAALGENTIKSAVLKLLTMLSPEDRKAAEGIGEIGDADVLLEYLKTKIPNVDDVIAEETKAVVAEFKKMRDEAK